MTDPAIGVSVGGLGSLLAGALAPGKSRSPFLIPPDPRSRR